jgi:type IV pilus assembly protein PilW
MLAEGGQPCTLAEATNTPTAGASNQNTIKHATARYNPFGGMGPAYSANAVVMDLGPAPTANTYRIQNNSLVVDQLIASQFAQPVAANVVHLRALYGKDTNGDGIVDTWNAVAPVTSADWASVLAIRIVLVARSAQPEKPDPTTGRCTTTAALPSVTWDDGTVNDGTANWLDVSGSAPAGIPWQCFRYRVLHATTSLRNLIWTPS